MAAVVITRRQFDREVHHSKFFIDADLAPDSRVSCVRRGVVFPGFGAVFIRQRDGMEDPETLARPHIETANVALHILLADRHSAWLVRRTDNYRVAGHDRSRVESDVRTQEIDLLIVVRFQIDRAVFAKAANGRASLGVQRDKPVARCDIEYPLFPAVTPVRQSAAGKYARRIGSARALAVAVRP